MPSIDERVVSMAFENKVFEQRVAQTMATLSKLDASIKSIGGTSGLQNIEVQASKVTLQGPMSAVDKLKAKLGFDMAPAAFSSLENASTKTTFATPQSALDKLKSKLGFSSASQSFSELESASQRTTLRTPQEASDKLKGKLNFASESRTFSDLEAASGRVSFRGPSKAVDNLQGKMGDLSGTTAFADLEAASGRVSFDGLTQAIEGAAGKFSILTGAASVAFGNLTTMAAQKGASMVKNVTFGPITQGFQEYTTNLNALQTTLANTESKGETLKTVQDSVGKLNEYSDQTIYNFGEMAKNIGTFTAAGVGLKDSVEAIKGIANLAAVSGASSEKASGAMYQLSQAIAGGRVNLEDWNSVVQAGMGGEIFQKALFNTAKAAGTLKDVPIGQTFEEWKKAGNTFKDSISATQKATASSADVMKEAHSNAAKTVADAQEAASESIASAADRVKEAQTSSAESVVASAERVKEAEAGVGDTARQSAEEMANATKAQSDTIKQAGEDVKSALDGVREARRRLVEAMKPPSADELQAAADKLKTAQLDQADLSTAVSDAQRDQARASQDLVAAQHKLATLKYTATADERLSAQRAVEDAQRRVTDASDAETRALLRQRAASRDVNQAAKDLQTTREKGTKKDANVKSAQDALTTATQNYKDAQVKAQEDIAKAAENVREVQRKGVEDQIKANQNLADAQKSHAKTIIDGQNRIADAEKDQAKTIEDAQERIADAHARSAETIQRAQDSLKQGKGPKTWLTSDVLTDTLAQFSGDVSDAELKAQGFTAAQVKEIRKMAETAKESATEVKGLGQVFSVALEAIGTGWADTFKIIFGDLGEAKKTFTELSNYIGKFILGVSDSRNKVFEGWKELGGRTQLIEGIKAAFDILLGVIIPITDAFRDIFPATTSKQLLELTKSFRELMENLKPGPELMDRLQRIFAGLFAVVDIGWNIVKGFAGVILDLLGIVGQSSGGFLEFVAKIGDFLVAVDTAVVKGGLLHGLFEAIGGIIRIPLNLIIQLARAIANLFGGGEEDAGKRFSDSLQGTNEKLKPLKEIIDKVVEGWHKFIDVVEKVKTALEPWFSQVVSKIGGIADVIGEKFKNLDYDTIMQGLEAGFMGGIFLTLKKAFGDGLAGVFGDALSGVNDVLGGLTDNLKAMQQNIQSTTLLKIGAAILVLAAGISILSKIPADKLTKAMTAVAVGLGELIGAIAILQVVAGGKGFLTIGGIATSMLILSFALIALAGAVKLFATMSWEDIGKGLVGVGGSLGVIAIAMQLMPGGPSMVIQSVGLIALALALNLIAVAVSSFSTLSWEELAKGLAGVVGSLLGIALAMSLMPLNIVVTAAGLLILGVALNAIAIAVRVFGEMDILHMVQGLVGMSLAIVGIGLALAFIPPHIALTAVGLLIMGQAMVVTAGAIALLGNLSIGTLVKGILALAATLVVLAVGLTLMIVTLPGALALMVVAGALAVLGPALGFLGTLKWSTIFKGMAVIGATLVTIGIAGLIAAPALAALGVALIPLGVGFLLIATAAKIFANAMQIMGTSGQKGIAVMVAAVTGFIMILPKIILDLIKGLVSIVEQVVLLAPKLVEALRKILTTVIAFIISEAPHLALAIGAIIVAVLKVIHDNAPKIQAAGFKLLQDLLTGLSQNIGEIVTKASEVVIKFLDGLAAKAPELTESGANTLVAFIQGITNQIPKVVEKVATMMTKFLEAMGRNAPRVIGAGQDLMIKLIGAIAGFVPKLIKKGTDIIISFLDGIEKAIPRLKTKALSVARTFLNNVADGLAKLAHIGFEAIIKFLNGLENAIRRNSKRLTDAGAGVASAIIDAMVMAFGRLGGVLRKALEAVFKLLPGWAKRILGISSPSKVFLEIGEQTMAGMALGLTSGGAAVDRSMVNVAEGVISTAKSTLGKVPNLLEGMMDTDPVISPILDLSNVEKEAERLGDVLPVPKVVAAASFGQAAAISDQQAILAAAVETQPVVGTTVHFEQNNYSPDPISNIELYRQTNNQISRIKSLVGVPV